MKSIVLDPRDWEDRIWPKLLESHGKAIAIRAVCKRRLGFTTRYHHEYVRDEKEMMRLANMDAPTVHSVRTVRLDFDDEKMKLMFMMKWCENAT